MVFSTDSVVPSSSDSDSTVTHVLLVDDSETDRLLFRRLMEKEPKTVVDVVPSGRAALAAIESKAFDAVVTDMQMPELNGLELTRAIRSLHPELPVVLLTGMGSEQLAIKALRDGASGYVAKSLAAELLVETVQRVVTLVRTRSGIDRLAPIADSVNIQLSLRNDLAALPGVVTMAQSLAKGISQTSSTGIIQLGAAVDAALSNALFRGNLQIDGHLPRDEQISLMQSRVRQIPYRNRRIKVRISLRHGELRIVVSDNGDGFDHREYSEMGLSLAGRRTGRGLFMMWAFMDRVIFNHAGNRVTLVKNAFNKQNYEPTQDAMDTDWDSPEFESESKMIRLN